MYVSVALEMCLPSSGLAMDISSGFTVLAFMLHITILLIDKNLMAFLSLVNIGERVKPAFLFNLNVVPR
jgi:hypothetical protein